MRPRVGIVVPTLGKRPDYLKQCLSSIRSAGEAHILLVAPKEFSPDELKSLSLIDSVIEDDGEGLAAAINGGIESLPADIEYVNWLGDDDLLTKDSLNISLKVLDSNKEAVMTFGACDYVDGEAGVIWTNRSGQWAVSLLRFGPDLIPQPGALFSRAAFEKVGGLRTDLGWAFDFDLFLKFHKLGKIKYLDQKLAQFRWHPESLSVEHREKSVAEASQVRVSHLPVLLRPISFLWEYPVRQATLIAGSRVTARTRSKAKSK